ncbi:MAG: GDP-mannose 4,6-dehydratase [Legionella sp.]|nr:GDP-mannose 4,6-dehydratase [Legionella sp.]
MNVLITGGAGFIGSSLVEYHLKKQDTVYVLDDLSTGYEKNIKVFLFDPNFHFIKADVLIYPDLEKIVFLADRIYHLAAVVGMFRVLKESEHVLAVNVGTAERLLQLARRSTRKPRFLMISTSEVYGIAHESPLKENSNLIVSSISANRSAYAISKITAESYALAYFHQFDVPITILRLFNTIGPRQMGQYGMVVPRFVKKAVAQEPLIVYGTGKQKRCFIDVRDVVCLMDEIAGNPEWIGEIVNLGSNQEISINELASLVKKIARSSSEIQHITYEKAYGQKFEDYQVRVPDLTKLKKHTQYHRQWDLERTLRDLIFPPN